MNWAKWAVYRRHKTEGELKALGFRKGFGLGLAETWELYWYGHDLQKGLREWSESRMREELASTLNVALDAFALFDVEAEKLLLYVEK